jgi:hypothetical protein
MGQGRNAEGGEERGVGVGRGEAGGGGVRRRRSGWGANPETRQSPQRLRGLRSPVRGCPPRSSTLR